MKLELADGTVIKHPNESEIEQAIKTLVPDDDGFAILSHDEMTYIQSTRSSNFDFELEYQAGDTDQHFRVSEPVPLDNVVEAFKYYARNDPKWKTEFNWERQAIGTVDRSGCAGVLFIVLVAMIFIPALVCTTL